MLYVKNPNYYDASNVTMENLNFMLNTDDAASYTAYNSGDLDFADRIPSVEIESLLTNSEFHVVDRLGTYYLTFNVNAPLFDGLTPEQGKKMRKAISLLIDRNYIVETIAQAGQVEADSFIPAGMSDGNGGFFKTEETSYYDAAKTGIGEAEAAMSLLEECGYSFTENGDGTYSISPALVIPYISNEGDLNSKVASSIQSDLSQIGIEMTVELQEKNAFYDNRKAGNYVLARGAWTADYNDPINMLQMFATESGNNSAQLGRGDSMTELNWDKYDALIAAITFETDMEKRVKLMHDAEDMLMDTYAVIPLYYSNDVYLQKSNVTGIYASETAQKYFMYAVKH
jgi:peptide/nickel transport system substrate-binding protein/oligopeptide transport system substrate-binding protein